LGEADLFACLRDFAPAQLNVGSSSSSSPSSVASPAKSDVFYASDYRVKPSIKTSNLAALYALGMQREELLQRSGATPASAEHVRQPVGAGLGMNVEHKYDDHALNQ